MKQSLHIIIFLIAAHFPLQAIKPTKQVSATNPLIPHIPNYRPWYINVQIQPYDAKDGLFLFTMGTLICMNEILNCGRAHDECTINELTSVSDRALRLAIPVSMATTGGYLLARSAFNKIMPYLKKENNLDN